METIHSREWWHIVYTQHMQRTIFSCINFDKVVPNMQGIFFNSMSLPYSLCLLALSNNVFFLLPFFLPFCILFSLFTDERIKVILKFLCPQLIKSLGPIVHFMLAEIVCLEKLNWFWIVLWTESFFTIYYCSLSMSSPCQHLVELLAFNPTFATSQLNPVLLWPARGSYGLDISQPLIMHSPDSCSHRSTLPTLPMTRIYAGRTALISGLN